MYETYFGLSERPFSIAPDPQYLYMSTRHKEAMAHLSYGLSQGGCFIVLTGEVGTGKTTLCRNLLGDLPENVDVALILNANINEDELLETICDELNIGYQAAASQKQMLDTINQHLLDTFAANRHTVLIIDEAQLLSRDVLEKIRLLTNLETTKNKLLQIILIGQPELNDLLSRNDLRQLAQRVTARYHLGALERSEIEEYVNYRLAVAGCKQPLFSRQALNSLHSATNGIPRKINVLADHALLASYSKNQNIVDAKTIRHAANDVFIQSTPVEGSWFSIKPSWQLWLVAALFLCLNLALWWWFIAGHNEDSTLPAAVISESQQPLLAPQTPEEPPAITSNIDQARIDLPSNAAQVTETPIASTTKIDEEQQVTIITKPDIQPGTVTLSEEFLDASPIISEQTLTTETNATAVSAVGNNTVELDPAFDDVLETSADVTGRITGFKQLAELWQVTLPTPLFDPVCSVLLQEGLRCLTANSWAQLINFNRPAIMVLEHQDQLHRVVLRSIDGDKAFVQLGESIREVTVNALQNKWIKQATALWRTPSFGTPFSQNGDQSDVIPAIRDYLNRALVQSNLPPLNNVTSDQFDIDMSKKVFTMQTRFGITPDSKIGNETYLLMNEILNPDNTLVLSSRLANR